MSILASSHRAARRGTLWTALVLLLAACVDRPTAVPDALEPALAKGAATKL